MISLNKNILIFTLLISNLCLASPEQDTSEDINSPPAENVESSEDIIQKLEQSSLEKARENITSIQNDISKETSNKDNLIRPELLKTNKIEESITNEINIKREHIKTFIYNVAQAIENNEEVTVSVDDHGLSIKKLMEAKNKNNITARSVKLAFDILSKINDEIINKATQETDPVIKRELALQEAALVYEMADLTIEIVNDAVLDGSPTLKEYKVKEEDNINKDITEIKKSIESLEERNKNGTINNLFFKNIKKSYENQIEVNITLLDKWRDIGVIFDKQDQQLEMIKKSVSNIEDIRNNANFQINILKRTKIVKAVHSTVGPINGLIDISQSLRLIDLDSSYFSDICITGDCPKTNPANDL